ncbi:hypothetical protein MLD38_005751 [Melastoma candidum]|uniref:Uncharacterized protein n=1 Tax=Melastoma candidum TaxID=119954 RepID=A0ACB9RK41_9MYRT|nr:hypothetical protein MLD38_005751 [Melastoma candidum]
MCGKRRRRMRRTFYQDFHLFFIRRRKRFKKKKMSWSGGDWMCAACQHQNFKKREACQRCGYPKFGGPDVAMYLCNRTEVLAGDWYCTSLGCGAHNYASRPTCYRCGALKSDYAGGNIIPPGFCPDGSVMPPGWKTGDWICTRYGCGVHNYASRIECFKCKTPRDFGDTI